MNHDRDRAPGNSGTAAAQLYTGFTDGPDAQLGANTARNTDTLMGMAGGGIYESPPPMPLAKLIAAARNGRASFIHESDFGAALKGIREGFQFARRGWNGRGMHIALQSPGLNDKMTQPYIYMKTADGNLVPWLASQSDMLANDWEIVG